MSILGSTRPNAVLFRRGHRLALFVATLLIAVAASSPATAQRFVVEEFFNGPVRLVGDLWIAGRGTRRLTVDINGTWNGRTLTLYEVYETSEGKRGKQTWKLEKTGPNRFVGSRTNLLGPAVMTVAGNQTLRVYTSMETVSGVRLPVSFIDRMTMLPDGVVRCVSKGFLGGLPVVSAEVYLARPAEQHLLAGHLAK